MAPMELWLLMLSIGYKRVNPISHWLIQNLFDLLSIMTAEFRILCKSSIEYGAFEPPEAVILSDHISQQGT
jgi:hypothetical protein